MGITSRAWAGVIAAALLGPAAVDAGPKVEARNLEIGEGTGQVVPNTLRMTMWYPVTDPVTVRFEVRTGTAQPAKDFVVRSNTVTFAPGATTATLPIEPVPDSADEPHEGVVVTIVEVSPNAHFVEDTFQVTFLDDDRRPALCRPILYVPFIVATEGRHCFVRDLVVARPLNPYFPIAVSIQADDVTVDLGGHELASGSFGDAGWGFDVFRRRGVTIRNGTVRGFEKSVYLESVFDPVVEDLVLVAPRAYGIDAFAERATIRRNRILDAGWYGMRLSGLLGRVLDNDVIDPARMDGGMAFGIVVDGFLAIVERNRVAATEPAHETTGIFVNSAGGLVSRNQVQRTGVGIRFNGSGLLQSNLTAGVTAPFPPCGCTDGGGNN
jgi:hypothetical protein